jgi:hypothetical protein
MNNQELKKLAAKLSVIGDSVVNYLPIKKSSAASENTLSFKRVLMRRRKQTKKQTKTLELIEN